MTGRPRGIKKRLKSIINKETGEAEPIRGGRERGRRTSLKVKSLLFNYNLSSSSKYFYYS